MREPYSTVIDNGVTIMEILNRLHTLEGKMEEAGEYGRSNTVWLAQEAIRKLATMQEPPARKTLLGELLWPKDSLSQG